MLCFSTPAVLLRRIDHGDYDLILNLFTRENGKITVTAKYAKKSIKRFAGVLELFSEIRVVYSTGRHKGMPLILQEAGIENPFAAIRTDIRKTAYASYWAEIMNTWLEEGQKQPLLYDLLCRALAGLDEGQISSEVLHILFQMKFMVLSGWGPNLKTCNNCGLALEEMTGADVRFDLHKGGLLCDRCAAAGVRMVHLSKGTVKYLRWSEKGDLKTALRMRFSPQALAEGRRLLESFVSFHLEKEPKSLNFLRQIR